MNRALVLALLALSLGVISIASAQRRERRAPRVVPLDATVQWTVFVSAHRESPARRSVVGAEAGAIEVPIAGWSCTHSAPQRAQLDETNWSEVRTLECTNGDAVVSTTGFCQIAGASWGARAAVLALGARTDPGRVSVTLDCAVAP